MRDPKSDGASDGWSGGSSSTSFVELIMRVGLGSKWDGSGESLALDSMLESDVVLELVCRLVAGRVKQWLVFIGCNKSGMTIRAWQQS
ncbi:hypothetical protein OAM67_00935 [bacterium]|nr:hypothetical protein [bacterium]